VILPLYAVVTISSLKLALG